MAAKKDIFISYKNDGEGRNFAARLYEILKKMGYSVYYNPDEQHAGSFPERLRDAIENCTDFILVLTKPCLEQLKAHEEVDWVREELLTAKKHEKNIIPLLMPGVSMPKNKLDMPADLQFLPDKDAIVMTEQYEKSPLESLVAWLLSCVETNDDLKDVQNSSTTRSVDTDVADAIRDSKEGNYASMYKLANYYYYGIASQEGCKRDFEKAFELLSVLEQSDSEYADHAASILAEMYHHGIVPRKAQSYEKAYKLHNRAKDKNGFSSREFAYLKSRGCGCAYDYSEIESSYLEAIEQGDNMAIIGLAKIYMENGQFQKAADLYIRTSDVLPDADYRLGMLYRNGLLENPPKPDYFRAAFYFLHAIEAGQCEADVYRQLGRLYFTPTGGFPKDFALAEKYFLLAAERGSKDAHYKLGLIYEYGYTEKNIHKALKHYKIAADHGNAFAAYHLAMVYSAPEIKNYQKAAEYAFVAADKGVMEGEYLFGMFLFYGRGCEADENKAYEFFVRAYEHGMYQAKNMIDIIEKQNQVY